MIPSSVEGYKRVFSCWRSHYPASLCYFFGFSYALLGVCRCLNELKCAKPCCQCFAYLYYNYFWSINTGSSVLRTSTSLFNHIFCSSVLRQPSSTSSNYDFFCGEVSAVHEEESCGLHTSIMINAVKRQPWLSMPSNLFADKYDCPILDELLSQQEAWRLSKFYETISSAQGKKAYARRASDFMVHCRLKRIDWRQASSIQSFMEFLHEEEVFSPGSLWSIHSMVSCLHQTTLGKKSLVENPLMKRLLKDWTKSHVKKKAFVFNVPDVMKFLTEAEVRGDGVSVLTI